VGQVAHQIASKTPGVNFINILWATFAPKSFRQKITNPNCKHLRAVQRGLVWLSTFYKQLFHTKVLCVPFICLQFGFVFFGKRILAQKLLIKCWWNWHLELPPPPHSLTLTLWKPPASEEPKDLPQLTNKISTPLSNFTYFISLPSMKFCQGQLWCYYKIL